MVKRVADLTTFAEKLEAIRCLRSQAAKGQCLMKSTVMGCLQCLGNLKDCSENHLVLRTVLDLMRCSRTIDSPSVDVIIPCCTTFFELSNYPDKDMIPAMAVRDAWGIKRSLTTLRRKWVRAEKPKDSIAQDHKVRELVDMYDRIVEEALEGISIPRRTASDDDVGGQGGEAPPPPGGAGAAADPVGAAVAVHDDSGIAAAADEYEFEDAESEDDLEADALEHVPAEPGSAIASGAPENPIVEPSGVASESTESPIVEPSGVPSRSAENPVVEPSGVPSGSTENPVVEPSGVLSGSTENPVVEPSGVPSGSVEKSVVEPSGVPSGSTENQSVEPSGDSRAEFLQLLENCRVDSSQSTDGSYIELSGAHSSGTTENPSVEPSLLRCDSSQGMLETLIKEMEDEGGVTGASVASASSSMEVPPQDPSEKLKQILALSKAKLQALRAIDGPVTVDSDEELPPAPIPVARSVPVDNQETQAFTLDTQVVLEPIFQEEHKALTESPVPLVRRLFPENEDTGAGEPSAPAVPVPTENLSPQTIHTPSPLPADHKFMEFSPPKVITRADQLGLKRDRKELNEDENDKDGATGAAPKRKGRPPARKGKGRGRGRSAGKKGPMREQASSSKDVPKMVAVKRARECEPEPSAPVGVEEGTVPVPKPKTKSGKGKGKKAKRGGSDCADGRPAMLAVPVPEEVGHDDDVGYSTPVWTGDGENSRPSLAVCSAETGSAAAPVKRQGKKIRRKRSKAVRHAANDGEDNEEHAPHPVPMEVEGAPALDLDVEFNYPKTFAGRPCPQIEGNKGWLLWRHIVRSFIEIIRPNILDRSRTRREA
ncbi:unnamed protein product [Symbiodinium sp. CCMP2592]|nr:unnamed protein product [Symbiodinium sp. CCMP2592]